MKEVKNSDVLCSKHAKAFKDKFKNKDKNRSSLGTLKRLPKKERDREAEESKNTKENEYYYVCELVYGITVADALSQ